MKKNLHPRTEESISANEDNAEFARKKKAKKNDSEIEADSSSADHSRFVALVKASNLQKDSLDLPKGIISSNGLKRICRKIVLTDQGKRSWELDMRFKKSSGTFYITRGWRSFCDENRRKAGDLFLFKLVGKGETHLLSFCPAESRGEKASNKESLLIDPSSGKMISKEKRKKNHLKCRDSTSPSLNQFVTLRLTHASLLKCSQYLPMSFMRENGLDKPGDITLLGKDGTKWLVMRRVEASGRIYFGKGWKVFAKANGLKVGEPFKLELIWKGATPTLSLFNTESTSDPRQQGMCSKYSEKVSASTEPSSENKTRKANNREEKISRKLVRNKCHSKRRDSKSPIQNWFVTLTLEPEDVRACKLHLPSQFMRANGIDKLGKITLLGKDGMKCSAYRLSRDGFVALGIGWKGFCEINGVRTGESFTLELMYEEDATPVFRFCSKYGD